MKVILIGLLTSSIFTAISASDRGIPHKVLGNATSSVLEVLNAVRAEVEPLASGMQFLSWNEDLAQAALNYATKCRVRSNPNRVQEVIGLDEVGEIWAISRSTFTFIDYEQIAAETWIIESFAYLYDANECLKEDGCRNYTQLAWATATEVGCGSANCSDTEPNLLNAPTQFYVCYLNQQADYSKKPYISGEPCSTCLPKQSCFAGRLCDRKQGYQNGCS